MFPCLIVSNITSPHFLPLLLHVGHRVCHQKSAAEWIQPERCIKIYQSHRFIKVNTVEKKIICIYKLVKVLYLAIEITVKSKSKLHSIRVLILCPKPNQLLMKDLSRSKLMYLIETQELQKKLKPLKIYSPCFSIYLWMLSMALASFSCSTKSSLAYSLSNSIFFFCSTIFSISFSSGKGT